MFLIVSRYLIPKGYRGITLFPFVILRNPLDRQNRVLVNHEKIHIRQQLEFLIIPFFLWYFIEYGLRLIKYKNKNVAYRNISFEREAYSNEFNLDYIKNRKLWDFRKYL
jgi:hypothetical protein